MIRKQIYIEKAQEKAIEQLAISTGENASALIRKAIDVFVEREARKTAKNKKTLYDVMCGLPPLWQDETREQTHTRFRAMRESGNRKFE